MPQFIYLVVYRKVLFYIGVRARNIRFRLIVIVIGNEKLHPVVRKKGAEFVAELRRKRFIVRDNERGTVYVRDDVRHRKRFARTRNAQKHLRAKPVVNAFG